VSKNTGVDFLVFVLIVFAMSDPAGRVAVALCAVLSCSACSSSVVDVVVVAVVHLKLSN
jgi:hypothetical protein